MEAIKRILNSLEIKLFPHPGFYSSKERTIKWLELMEIKNYTINKDLTVDIKGSVNIDGKAIKYFPVQFGRIEGDFRAGNNPLYSLKGCPHYVENHFTVHKARIQNLLFSPCYVGGSFNVNENRYMTSLEGSPETINGDFHCAFAPIKNLIGSPQYIKHDFNAYACKLESLEGCPINIGNEVDITHNNLKNFKGIKKLNCKSIFAERNNIQNLEFLDNTNFCDLQLDEKSACLFNKDLFSLMWVSTKKSDDSRVVLLGDKYKKYLLKNNLEQMAEKIEIKKIKNKI